MILLSDLKKCFYNLLWRKNNSHNQTYLENCFRFNKVSVGKKTYGGIKVFDSSSADTKLKIGNYCSISPGVYFLLGAEHQINSISTYPFKVRCFGHEREAGSKGDIIINDDVWIGTNAIISSGVEIGQGAIIAAGAVVSKNIPPYSISGGVPAKIIKYRFSESIITRLLQIDLCGLFDKFDSNDIPLIYNDLDENTLSKILEKT